MKEIPKIVRTV